MNYQIVSSRSEKYHDSKVINFSNKFSQIDKKYETTGHPNGFIRYMLRNEYQNYDEWSRYYLNPKKSYSHHYFSYKTKDIYLYEKRHLSEFITNFDWLYYCIPQLIQSYIHDLLNESVSIREYENRLGLSMYDYNYMSLS